MKTACFFSTENQEQISKQQYSIQDISILRDLGYDVKIANKLSNIPWGCDLYFAWWASGSILPLIIAKLSHRPIIVVAGGNEVLHYRDSVTGISAGFLASPLYKRVATKTTLRYADAVTVVSNFMAEGIRKLSTRPVSVIHNSINTNLFKCTNQDRSFVLTIVNLEKRTAKLKRAEIFIRAIPNILNKYPDQKFVVIGGDGDAKPELMELIRHLKIEENIVFTGPLNNSEIVNWMNRSKTYVQISDTETFGVSIGEAMSCGTPVVVSKMGAIPELVGDCGIYVDHNNPESVADGIISVLQMKEEDFIRTGNQSRERVISYFSYEQRRSLIKSLISDVC